MVEKIIDNFKKLNESSKLKILKTINIKLKGCNLYVQPF